MPFDCNNERISEANLRKIYPMTWQYLIGFKDTLAKRAAVLKGSLPWWAPERPRTPTKLMVPKIVTPHLVLLPRFGIDEEGKYAVSRGPYLVPQSGSDVSIFLKVMCAMLNSAVGHWQLSFSSHKYSRGYLMLEVKTLRDFHMPEPAKLASTATRRIVQLVDKLFESPNDHKLLIELDYVVGDAYGLSEEQLSIIGVGI
jgi:hypothetical protein